METIKKQSFIKLFIFMWCFCFAKQQVAIAAQAEQYDEWPEWKLAIRQEFLQDLSQVQNIVVQGETPQETADFLHYFSQQIVWLDKTLATAFQPTEPDLCILKQQKNALGNIVRIQKETEIILQNSLRSVIIESPRYAMLRLMILYEINSLMMQPGNCDRAPFIAKTLSGQQEQQIVEKVLQKEAVHTQDLLVAQKEQFDRTEKFLQEKLEETQALLHKAEQANLGLKQEYAQNLEAITENNVQLQTTILVINEELAALRLDLAKNQENLASLKTYARDQQNQRIGAELKMQLTEELADLRYSKKSESLSSSEKINSQEQALRKVLEQELAERIAAKNNKK
jgi:hypothetical protein